MFPDGRSGRGIVCLSGFWSSETLKDRLPERNLVKPFDEDAVVNCAYELSLGEEVYVTGEGSGRKRALAMGEQVRIPPGQFANLLTEETVTIPADALGLISAKFRWKQRGLVNVSGFHVDPGYSGKILFSVYNAGPMPVVIARGDSLFLLWYCSLDRRTTDTYRGGVRTDISSVDVGNLVGEVATPQALAARVESLERTSRAALWVVLALVTAIIGWGVRSALPGEGPSSSTSTSTSTTSSLPTSTTSSVPTSTTQPP